MATAKKSNTIEVKDFIHASLGLQVAAYDFGKDKFDEFTEKAKSDLDDYISRGAKVEKDVISRFDDFKAKDNLIAKGLVQSEEQYKKVQTQVEEQVEKLQKQIDELAEKAKDFREGDNVLAKAYSKAEEQYKEQLEKVKDSTSQLTEKYDEFKAKDNVLAKGLVQAEERVQKLQSQLEEWNEKAKELIPFETKAPAKKKAAPKKAKAKKATAKKKAAPKKAKAA